MLRYHLAPHTQVCVTAQGSVFLDVRRDAYVGIDVEQSASLAGLIEGWPIPAHGTQASDEAIAFAESLCKRALLTRAPGGHTAAPPALAPLREELIAWEHMGGSVRAHHVLRFFLALFLALFTLRGRSLHAAVRRCDQRWQRSAGQPFPLQKARELLSAYTLIQLFVFSRRGRCLLDSLTLMEFLAAYGVHPRWVLGVQARPFAAHSWVQHEGAVLNGTLGFVRTYRPILVV